MIASYSREFIFIKTRKTGGTSVEIVLSSWCESGDTCAPISPEDELLRASYGGSPRRFCKDRKLEADYKTAIESRDVAAIKRAYQAMKGYKLCSSHMPATKVRAKFADLWEKALVFTIERHPYDKVVSAAYWSARKHKSEERIPVEKYIERIIRNGSCANYPLYMESNDLLVDKILDHSDLWNELESLDLFPSLPDELPKAKSQFRQDRRPGSEILSQEQKRRIYDATALEFEIMGYER